MRVVLAGVLLLASVAGAEAADGGTPVKLFDVTQAAPVKQAERAMESAGGVLRSRLPDSWQEPSVLGLERWQWGAIPVLAVLVALLAVLLTRGTRVVARRFSRGSQTTEQITLRLIGPLKLWWTSLLALIALPALGLTAGAEDFWRHVARVGLTAAFFWGAFAAVTAWSEHFGASEFAVARPGSRALVGLFTRIARFALIGFAALAVLSELGYSVTSVLAGLGIGGIALALGAQKTLENVFGAFALAVDQPIREGEFVRIDNTLGTVESIGLRSTRLRTLDRTVVSIPNGKLAEMRLETFAARDRIRYAITLGLVHGTPSKTVKAVCAGFTAVLEAQATLHPGSASVRLAALGDSALQLEIAASFVTDPDTFTRVREEVLLGFLEVVEKEGTALAFPTSTVHLAGKQ
ncbi:MAG: mechanosensitive ion channel family protein [Myxococcota bacterium]